MTEQALTTERNKAAMEFQSPQPDTILTVINRAASDPNTDVGKMEHLMQMYERMENRKAEQAFHAAMAQMQMELPEISERGEVRHNGKLISKYARWEDVNRAIKPILHKHGFSLTFRVDTENKVQVEGVLSHQNGHSERTSITLPSDTGGAKNAVQAVASSVSYGKRYVAGALLNLTSSGDDDDGNGGDIPRITEEQAANIRALIEEVGADESRFLKYMQAQSIESIQSKAYDQAVKMLERKRKAG